MDTLKLYISDKRMLELIEILQHHGVIKYRQEFLDAIGMHKQTLPAIKNGLRSFTIKQIEKACETYNVNANWLIAKEENIFRLPLTLSYTEGANQRQND